MLLKRKFKTDESGALLLDADDNPILDKVIVKQAGDTQHFTQEFINDSVASGLMSFGNGKLTLHTEPELIYNVVRTPGYYCCHDNKGLGDQKQSERYVADNFADVECKDKNNPAGYRKDNFFYCELEK